MNALAWLLPLAALLGLFVGYFAQKLTTARTLGDAEARAQRILEDAKRLVDQAARDSEAQIRDGEAKVREAEARIRAGELEAKSTRCVFAAELDQESRARQKEIQGSSGASCSRKSSSPPARPARSRDTDAQNRERSMTERERVMTEKEGRLATRAEDSAASSRASPASPPEEANAISLPSRDRVPARGAAHGHAPRRKRPGDGAARKAGVLATTIQRLAPDYTV